jgi:hypothetical protein
MGFFLLPRPDFAQPPFRFRRDQRAQGFFGVGSTRQDGAKRLPSRFLCAFQCLRFLQHGIAQARGRLENANVAGNFPRSAALVLNGARGLAYPDRQGFGRIEERHGPEHVAQSVLAGDEAPGRVHSACPNSRRKCTKA